MTLIVDEIVPSDFDYFNLVDQSLVEELYPGSETISNIDRREFLKKNSLFPFELITNLGAKKEMLTRGISTCPKRNRMPKSI